MLLRALVTEHGAAKVYQHGMDALGFPPLWISTREEAIQVLHALS